MFRCCRCCFLVVFIHRSSFSIIIIMSLAYVLACTKATLLKSSTGNTGTWSGGEFIVVIDGIAFNENITMDSLHRAIRRLLT